MRKILFFREYLKKRYGKPLYRVPVDLRVPCPHRDDKGRGGCLFCAEDGARARHLTDDFDLVEQVRRGVSYIRRRYGSENGLAAYFQAYTSTNAPVEKLRVLFERVLQQADFEMVIVATRPDCLPDDVIDYLEQLSRTYDVWVELGVQSTHDKTLEAMNRGHDFVCVESAVKRLAERHLNVAAHVILGLPGETADDFRETALKLSRLPFSGVKIHHLMVLKDTPLAKLYHKHHFEVLNEYEYADVLVDFLKRLPDDWPVMRIMGDADPEMIVAPKWWMKKGQFIDYVVEKFNKRDQTDGIPKIRTEDGSWTFYHPKYKEHFHALAGATSESKMKFIEPSRCLELDHARILDIGFGLGHNALETLKVFMEEGKRADIVSLEQDLTPVEGAFKLLDETDFRYEILRALLEKRSWRSGDERYGIDLIVDDARKSVFELAKSKTKFHHIFLDAFSPKKNPELWTYDFIRQCKSLLDVSGTITTYSSAYPVRGALLRAGFKIGETPAFGKKRGGTIASLDQTRLAIPVSDKELAIILQATAGVPYRDPNLCCSPKQILIQREKVVSRLRRKGVPKWVKPKI